MRFSDKLGRLPPPKENEAKGPDLDELRAKMATLLGVGAAAKELRPEARELGDFPFERAPTGRGSFHALREVLRPSHHVGAIPIDAARSVDMSLLSLLALDPSLGHLDPSKALFLDTETTGLRGSGVLPFLVGLAWFEGSGGFVFEQFFLRDPEEETAMLEVLRERLGQVGYLVTFNGKAYDWPLLQARTVMNQIPRLPELPHLDLLPLARRLHKARLGSAKLTLLEAEVLGFDRGDDDVHGSEIAPRYAHFLRSGDFEALRPVVSHNRFDVLTMAALVGLYGEPLDLLHPDDLARASLVASRGKELSIASEFVEKAIIRGAEGDALVIRARLSKARGDRGKALLEFEEASSVVSDPKIALELTKLYEHHAKDFEKAFAWLERGTGETPEAFSKRERRLAAKRAAKKK